MSGNFVGLAYNDASVVLKTNFMLDPLELDLVVQLRHQIKSLERWEAKVAQLGRSQRTPRSKLKLEKHSKASLESHKSGLNKAGKCLRHFKGPK